MPEADEKTRQIAAFARQLPTFEYDQGIGIEEALMAYTWRQLTAITVRGKTVEEAAELCREAADHVAAAMIATRKAQLN
jgi:hypothetical protein